MLLFKACTVKKISMSVTGYLVKMVAPARIKRMVLHAHVQQSGLAHCVKLHFWSVVIRKNVFK